MPLPTKCCDQCFVEKDYSYFCTNSLCPCHVAKGEKRCVVSPTGKHEEDTYGVCYYCRDVLVNGEVIPEDSLPAPTPTLPWEERFSEEIEHPMLMSENLGSYAPKKIKDFIRTLLTEKEAEVRASESKIMADAIEMSKQGWKDEGRKEALEEVIGVMPEESGMGRAEKRDIHWSFVEGWNDYRTAALASFEQLKNKK